MAKREPLTKDVIRETFIYLDDYREHSNPVGAPLGAEFGHSRSASRALFSLWIGTYPGTSLPETATLDDRVEAASKLELARGAETHESSK